MKLSFRFGSKSNQNDAAETTVNAQQYVVPFVYKGLYVVTGEI